MTKQSGTLKLLFFKAANGYFICFSLPDKNLSDKKVVGKKTLLFPFDSYPFFIEFR